MCDPVYPVYVDTNVMAGRTGEYNTVHENFERCDLYAMHARKMDFCRSFPSEVPDLIYLCFPNNPTGSAITKDAIAEMGGLCQQKWLCDYL